MKNYILPVLLWAVLCLATPLAGQDSSVMLQADAAFTQQFRELVYTQISYPEAARRAGLSAAVKVRFTVSPAGQVLNVEAEYLGPALDIPASDWDLTVVANASPTTTDPQLMEMAVRSLQAESLMVLQRIPKLPATVRNGQAVLSVREAVFRFILE